MASISPRPQCVNQGENASPTLFRMYLDDLGEYLTKHVGLCISDTIVARLLWADDLVLVSDSEKGLQEQLNGLQEFAQTIWWLSMNWKLRF